MLHFGQLPGKDFLGLAHKTLRILILLFARLLFNTDVYSRQVVLPLGVVKLGRAPEGDGLALYPKRSG